MPSFQVVNWSIPDTKVNEQIGSESGTREVSILEGYFITCYFSLWIVEPRGRGQVSVFSFLLTIHNSISVTTEKCVE